MTGVAELRRGVDRVAFARALGVVPDSWQEEMLRSDADRVLLNCSRQSGKSQTSAILALHTALYHPGSLVLVLAPAERQAKELFSKIATFYRSLGHTVPDARADSARKLGMQFGNGSRIEALPGSEKTIRGFSGVDLLILDEASRIDDELYYALRPMLSVSGGRLLMLSTPYGRRGVFFEAWSGAESWERYEVPASDVPRITAAFLAEERRALPARVYRQEYRCSFEEVEGSVFSYETIQRALNNKVEPLFGPGGPTAPTAKPGATPAPARAPLWGGSFGPTDTTRGLTG